MLIHSVNQESDVLSGLIDRRVTLAFLLFFHFFFFFA